MWLTSILAVAAGAAPELALSCAQKPKDFGGQIAIGTIVAAMYLMIQLQAQPYKNQSDNYLAVASSFSLLMVFFCSVIYKYAALTAVEDLQDKMSIEQKGDYIVDNTLLLLMGSSNSNNAEREEWGCCHSNCLRGNGTEAWNVTLGDGIF